MFFGCWIIRGPKEHMKQREVRKFIHEHHLSILGLVETKVKVVNKDMVLKARPLIEIGRPCVITIIPRMAEYGFVGILGKWM